MKNRVKKLICALFSVMLAVSVCAFAGCLEEADEEHQWEKVLETSATCETDGVREHYECKDCGEWALLEGENYVVVNNKDDLVIPAAHSWGSEVAEKSATCGVQGEKAHYECSVCHKKAVYENGNFVIKEQNELDIAALEHDFSISVDEVPATCEREGMKAYSECSLCHKKAVQENGTYVIKEQSELVIAALEHDFSISVDEVPSTCEQEGRKAYYECSVCHKKAIKDGENYVIVSNDNELIIPMHQWGELHQSVEATCTTDGTKPYKECAVCGKCAPCDESGNMLDKPLENNADAFKIPHGHSYVFSADDNAYKCGDCGNTMAARESSRANLNVHDEGGSYVADENDIELALDGFDLVGITGVTMSGVIIDGYTFENNTLAIPYFAFAIDANGRYPFGECNVTVTGITGRDFNTTVTFPVLFITKILYEKTDFDDFGNIALAQADNTNVTEDKKYSYAGYFELGADIDCGGERYTMVAAASKQVSASEGGFSGVFDGKGYTVSNLLIGADRAWHNGWDGTSDDAYQRYSFFGRLDGGKVCNVSFTGVKLNPIANVICSSGYGEISNVYAQIDRCAPLIDVVEGQNVGRGALGFCFSNGTEADAEKLFLSEIIVDFSKTEYCKFGKGGNSTDPTPAGPDRLASYDYSVGFIDDPDMYNVFGNNVTNLENCFVIGYPGESRNGEIVYATYGEMNISTEVADKFDLRIFATRDGMILPKYLAEVYDKLPDEFNISVDNDILMKGAKLKIDLGGFEYFATLVSDSENIKYVNGYIVTDDEASGRISFSFVMKSLSSNTLTITVYADEGEVFDAEVEKWVAAGAKNIGSSLNSSESVDKFGTHDVYKTTGGWNIAIASAIDIYGYKELYFAYKTSAAINLSSSSSKNLNAANTWYIVKLVRQSDDSWKIYAKKATEADYTELVSDAQYFSAANASFTTMFKTWLWGSNGYDIYATDVWGMEREIEETIGFFVPEGAAMIAESAMNSKSTKEEKQISGYTIYKTTGINVSGAQSIGYGMLMNSGDYAEYHFAMKVTAAVTIFGGSNTPALAANKWYAVKLVKEGDYWKVYVKDFDGGEYVNVVLDENSQNGLKTTGEVWFSSVFKTVKWDTTPYDVYTTALYGVKEKPEETIGSFVPEGAAMIAESAMNSKSTKEEKQISGYTIYKTTGINVSGAQSIGYGMLMNSGDYTEYHFAMKITAAVTIFGGSNTPALAANKWYAVKLVKEGDYWKVYVKDFDGGEYVNVVLDENSQNGLKTTGEVWFSSVFKTVKWDTKPYDVYTTALYGVK